ncbi:MAG: fumarylacetoacetate hydrolase family protein [Halobacteriaceae archaeon]
MFYEVMLRIGQTESNEVLIGDEKGFISANQIDPTVSSPLEWIKREPDNIPDLDMVNSDRRPATDFSFDVPLDLGRICGIGLNYADHITDLDADRPEIPAIFLQPQSAVTGPGGPIILPPDQAKTNTITAEAELALIFSETCRDVDYEHGLDVIGGFVPVIDITAEDLIRRNPRFLTRAKSYDTFLVVGPWVTILNSQKLSSLTVTTKINDKIIAEDKIENMVFSPPELVASVTTGSTHHPGDLLCTGTPGAGTIQPGDSVTARVESIGTLSAIVKQNSE